MKKRASSSLKFKKPQAPPRFSIARQRVVVNQRRRSRSSASKIKSAGAIAEAAESSIRSSAASVATPPAEIQANANLARAIQPIAPVRQDIIVENHRPGVVDFRIVTPPPPSVDNEKQRNKVLMWVGVTISMVVIVTGWVWTLRSSLAIPQDLTSGVQANQTEESLTDLFQQVSKSLDNLQKAPSAVTNLTPLTQESAPELNAQEIELLKRKIEEQAKNQQAPVSVPAVKQ